MRLTAWKPPRKAKDDPRKAGTFILVQIWKNSVPKPAKNSVVWMFSGRPYSWTRIGTKTVAPNMANMCCKPKISIWGTPKARASRMGCPSTEVLFFVHGFLLSNTFCPKAKKIPAPEPVKNGDQKRRCPSPASALQPTAYPFPPLIILTYYTERRPALQAAFSI